MSDLSTHEEKKGYKHPPKHTRFKPGQSGNPKGRPPKKQRVPIELWYETLNAPVTLKTPHGTKVVSAHEAFVKSMFQRALNGDTVAVREIMKISSSPAYLAQQQKATEKFETKTDKLAKEEDHHWLGEYYKLLSTVGFHGRMYEALSRALGGNQSVLRHALSYLESGEVIANDERSLILKITIKEHAVESPNNALKDFMNQKEKDIFKRLGLEPVMHDWDSSE